MSAAAASPSADLPRSMAGGVNPWIVAIIVSIATFMEVLDTSIANVSLQHIAGSLAAGPDESTWVLTSYLVANAIILPISGWLGKVFGRKQFYMACVALFTISSLLCGLAPSLGWLVFFRILQGLGGGGLAPSEQSMLADTFKPSQRGFAFAIYGIAVVFAPAIGPTLGGWITDNYSWHWIFLINVPVGMVSLLLSYLVLKEPETEKSERKNRLKQGVKVDYVGFALVALGLGCMQVVLDKGEREDWFESNFIIAFTIISVLGIVSMIVWESFHDHPIVNLKLYRIRSFATSNVLMFIMGFILFGTTQLIPQLTQSLYGYTATIAGLVITPGGVVVMIMMPLVGFLINKTQAKYLVAVGMAIEAAAMWRMSNLSLDAAYIDFMWARIFQAAGLAFLFVPITTASYAGVPPDKSGDASALINLMRNLGGSFGISLAQTWLAQGQQRHQTHLVGNIVETHSQYLYALKHMTQTLLHSGAAEAQVRMQGLAQTYKLIQTQAAILSYLDVFRWMCYFAAAALPLVLLLKRVKPGQAQAH